MNFATALNQESRLTYTENGATAHNTTGTAVLDLFATIGALRSADETRIHTLFAEAYMEDPLLATKCLFYARDIRGGLGERKTFRILLKYAAIHHPESIRPNISLIPFYGRYDDWYELIGTPLEDDMWKIMKHDFEEDLEDMMVHHRPVSLLAKWMKTADASSKTTRQLGILTAKKLGLSVYDYKRKVRALRRYLDVTEIKMTERNWDQINYPAVPSRAMLIYKDAFSRHDFDRFEDFLQKVEKGEEKINAATLYPYDIIGKYIYRPVSLAHRDPVLEEQWKALPNYVTPGSSVMVIADTSGSMIWNGGARPMNTALSLAIYFAERNVGPYHNLWMSFSDDSKIQRLKGESLNQKLANIDRTHFGGSTNLESAFMQILEIAVKNHVPAEEMVKAIVIISDMEINGVISHGSGSMIGSDWFGNPVYGCQRDNSWSFYYTMEERFRQAGYKIPCVVFWNVHSRHDVFHVDSERKGVMLCSGSSASTFKNVMDAIDMTPIESMLKVLNGERYSQITIGGR